MADRPRRPLPGVPTGRLPVREEGPVLPPRHVEHPALPPEPGARAQPQERLPAAPPPPSEREPSTSVFDRSTGRAKELAAWAGLATAVLGGIAGTVAAVRTGGAAQAVDVQTSAAAQLAAINAAEERLRLAIGLDREALKLRVDELERRQAKEAQRIEIVADWVCAENQGEPAQGWPCDRYSWEGPPRGRLAPERRTAAQYP